MKGPWAEKAGHWGPRLLAVGALFLAGAGVAILRVYDPASAGFFPPCPFRAMTGYLCPGCGTTRALHEILNGNIWAAFRFNPLMMFLLPYVGYAGMSSAMETLFGRALPRVFIRPAYIWTLLAVILAFWVVRNLLRLGL